ncbi:MAG: AraC family transcriptional regulator [Spirochaetaceae bacterium]|jgi:AraC family transcriptional regulator of arabinose operon|nr:AraC family transcriptional regulator [Spirochaetaceae bacterium]
MKNWLFLNVTNHEKKLPYYLYGAGNVYDQENVFRPVGCPWFQLNICQRGSGILKMNNQEKKISEGDSMIIYPDVPHEYFPNKSKMIVSWVAFDGFQVSSMLKSMGIHISGLYKLMNNNEIHESIKEILPVQKLSMTEQSYEGSKLVYSFLLTLMKNFSPDEYGKNDYSIEKMKPALEFMTNHISEPISIEDIANSMNITPQHFCLIFKSTMNQRPFEYLNSLRINHSKHLLLDFKEMAVKEISRLSGYPNHSYFCQLFKTKERLTPAEFRKLYKQD